MATVQKRQPNPRLCSVMVEEGIPYIVMPDGTPIPCTTSINIIHKAGGMPIAEISLIVNLIDTPKVE